MKAVLLAAALATLSPSVALGQQSTHYKTWSESLRQVEQVATPEGWTTRPPPIDRGFAPSVMPDADEIVVIKYGRGGRIDEHTLRFASYRQRRTKVEIRGPCYSACTMVMGYVPKTDVCFAEGSFLAYHAVRMMVGNEIMPAETAFQYQRQPEDIRAWIDRHGGHAKLPLDGFWTLRDRELWAMGYLKCN